MYMYLAYKLWAVYKIFTEPLMASVVTFKIRHAETWFALVEYYISVQGTLVF